MFDPSARNGPWLIALLPGGCNDDAVGFYGLDRTDSFAIRSEHRLLEVDTSEQPLLILAGFAPGIKLRVKLRLMFATIVGIVLIEPRHLSDAPAAVGIVTPLVAVIARPEPPHARRADPASCPIIAAAQAAADVNAAAIATADTSPIIRPAIVVAFVSGMPLRSTAMFGIGVPEPRAELSRKTTKQPAFVMVIVIGIMFERWSVPATLMAPLVLRAAFIQLALVATSAAVDHGHLLVCLRSASMSKKSSGASAHHIAN
jgi:hypothetical protein